MEKVGVRLKFEDNAIQLDGERIEQEWKPTWKRVKAAIQKGTKQMKITMYQFNEQRSRFLIEQEEECHLCLNQNHRKQNVIYHVNAGTDGRNKILEGDRRTD